MKFLADESVERALVVVIRSIGHDVTYVAELAPGIEDEEVLSRANVEARLLLTNDKDFGELVFRSQRSTEGILLLRLGTERVTGKIVALRTLLENHAHLLPGHFTVLGAQQIRRRILYVAN